MSEEAPPSEAVPPGQPAPPAPPFAMKVILQGYKLYRLLLLVTYGFFITIGIWANVAKGLPDQSGAMGAVIAGIGVVFGGAVLYSFRIPRVSWAWSYHASVICLGIPLCMPTPFALAVGWTWLHPGVRAYYGILPEPEFEPEPEQSEPEQSEQPGLD